MFDDDNDGEGIGSAGMLKALLEKANAEKVVPAPEGSPRSVAEAYAKAKGIKLSAPDLDVKVRPNISAKIASAYEQMQHSPDDPKVQKAYQALIDETMEQYEAIQGSGLNIKKIKDGEANPYPNSKAVIADVNKNKSLSYFPTESGFGTREESFTTKHPMLGKTKYLDADGKPMLANDVFRVVHDYMGHAKEGNSFSGTGEERAYLEHKQLYSPEAQKALTAETRGQNSWVNYGPNGEANRANPAATTYADQKAGLLPDWATKHVDELNSPKMFKAKALAKMAGKAFVPAAIATSVLTAPSIDEAAAELLVGGTERLGPEKGSTDYEIENPQQNPELRKKMLQSILNK